MITTPHFNLIRKPAGIPSTFGKEPSFLDFIKTGRDISNLTIIEKASDEAQESFNLFGPDQEYGLLNRLDTPTSWLLYFARDKEAFGLYQKLQYEWKITKYYITTVYGQIRPLFWRISTPIGHHGTDATRMVALTSPTISHRSAPQQSTTYYERISYDKDTDTTMLAIEITKGVRHQIRCHLGSIGHPVLHDPLYTTKKQRQKRKKQGRYLDTWILELLSVWVKYEY